MESAVKPNNVISESILFGDAFDDMNFGSNDDDGFGLPSDDEENVDGGEDGDSDDWVSCDSSSSGIDVKGDIGDNMIWRHRDFGDIGILMTLSFCRHYPLPISI